MTNTTLKALVASILSTKAKKNAKIEYTQHGNGYCVCIRVPNTATYCVKINGVKATKTVTEYSLPATFMVWGIQSEDSIKAKIDKFLGFYNHLAA